MGKIKKLLQCMPIKAAFLTCVSAFALIAVAFSAITCNWAQEQMFEIERNYSINLSDTSYSEISENTVFYYNFELSELELSSEDYRNHQIFKMINHLAPWFWSVFCLVCSALSFYQMVLKQPFQVLESASAHITDNNLDFKVQCDGSNELAQLCHSFETMRTSLSANNHEMMGMIEQRKRLNDAYTHELRTPVAVLRGYADMILKYYPIGQMPQEELMETVHTMSEHIERIEAFTDSMNTIQKLEDIVISPKKTDMKQFVEIIKNSADVLGKSQGITIRFQNTVCEEWLTIDTDAVLQVFENLLGNALRFANQEICISFSLCDNMLTMVIQDDGKGFTEKELRKAGQCYYSGKDSDGSYHFGLGLHIANLLCEKHGGSLLVENAVAGGAMVTARFDHSFQSV